MTNAIARGALRSVAVAIAIAGVIDPAWSRSVTPEAPVVAIDLTAAEPAAIVRALRDRLNGRELLVRQVVAHRLPCGPDEDCVLLADGSVDADRGDDSSRPMSMIVARAGGGPNVALRSVTMTSGHHAASGSARVELSAEGMQGRSTELRVIDGSALVGSTNHAWTAASAATVDVPWWPIAAGARALRIEAVPFEGERTAIDNRIDVGVMIAARRASVMVFDARPSWTSTFVRRALEDDGRFVVDYRARVAPALTAGTRNASLDVATLDEVSALIVGGPDALTSDDVTLLDRYVRVRGGTIVLLPERRSAGASASLFQESWTEHLTATSETIGPLRASEILQMTKVPVAATVIARSGTSPVIVSLPAGNGRVIVSGAMDAWRYRQLDSGPSTPLSTGPSISPKAGAFDRFWRSLLAQGASAGEGLSLSFARSIAPIGSRVRVTLRDRHFEPREAAEASATVRCDDGAAAVLRLWPTGTIGEFAGEVPASSVGACVVEATVGDRVTTGGVAVVAHAAAGVENTLARLQRAVRTSGGVVAEAGREGDVIQAIASRPTLSSVVSVHPMRVFWWMFPFAACLTAEWWLRRRQGLR